MFFGLMYWPSAAPLANAAGLGPKYMLKLSFQLIYYITAVHSLISVDCSLFRDLVISRQIRYGIVLFLLYSFFYQDHV